MPSSHNFCSQEGILFNIFTLADKDIFETALSRLSEPTSDNSFANIYSWKNAAHLVWSQIHNHLCVFANGKDLTLFSPPLPLPQAREEDLEKCLNTCFEIMDNYQAINCIDLSSGKIEYVSEEMSNYINNSQSLNLASEDFSGDYIYDTEQMINLSGGSLKRKRWAKHKFMKTYSNHRVEVLGPEHINDCFRLLNTWREDADEKKKLQVTNNEKSQVHTRDLRSLEIQACGQALVDHASLGMKGIVVYVDSVLVGFTLGEKLGNQASILFEKTHPDYDGSAQFIFSEFCRICWSDCKEINVGDDWFIPTLKETKESYRPIRRMKKYIISRMPDETFLRKVNRGDLDRITEIEHICFEPTIAQTKKQISNLILNPNVINIVAIHQHKVAGIITGFIRRHKNTSSGRIYSLAIDPEYRGRGIAKKLTQYMIKHFKLKGVAKVYLEVHNSNFGAINLYSLFGFRKKQDLEDYYGIGNHGMSMCLELLNDNSARGILSPCILSK